MISTYKASKIAFISGAGAAIAGKAANNDSLRDVGLSVSLGAGAILAGEVIGTARNVFRFSGLEEELALKSGLREAGAPEEMIDAVSTTGKDKLGEKLDRIQGQIKSIEASGVIDEQACKKIIEEEFQGFFTGKKQEAASLAMGVITALGTLAAAKADSKIKKLAAIATTLGIDAAIVYAGTKPEIPSTSEQSRLEAESALKQIESEMPEVLNQLRARANER